MLLKETISILVSKIFLLKAIGIVSLGTVETIIQGSNFLIYSLEETKAVYIVVLPTVFSSTL